MAHKDLVANLQTVCESISKMSENRERLIQRPEWGEIDFQGARQDLGVVFWLVSETGRLPVEILSDKVVQRTTD